MLRNQLFPCFTALVGLVMLLHGTPFAVVNAQPGQPNPLQPQLQPQPAPTVPTQPPANVPVPPPPAPSGFPQTTSPFTSSSTATPAASNYNFGQFLSASAAASASLASIPEMFGDSFYCGGGSLTLIESPSGADSVMLTAGVPLAASSCRTQIAQHNKAVPVDRVYFDYNHFHNAANASVVGTVGGVPFAAAQQASVDRYTFGVEKKIGDLWSAELRMPLAGQQSFAFGAPQQASIYGGAVGNLSLILKHVIYQDEQRTISAGIGFDFPTGDDAVAETIDSRLRVENETLYLLPYLAATGKSESGCFWHGFAQLDVPLNSHGVHYETFGILPTGVITANYRDQMMLHLDLGLGQWIYRLDAGKQDRPLFAGLAAIAEVHYTTTLEGTDVAAGGVGAGFPVGSFDIRSGAGQFDIVNLTTGLHLEIADHMTLRTGGVFPLRNTDRVFDAEFLCQLGIRF